MAQQARMEWEGRRLWTSRGRRKVVVGLTKSLEHVLTESNKLVPIDEGTLERSGRTQVDEENLRGIISYDQPYAVRQHEELSWKHAPGRQAKYLETAVNANKAKALEIMQNELRSWLRG